ncbi:MAG: HD domain-containing protein [Cyanobacteria bacterium SIG28]|nr:HD domain-containing protein [Cyanobacteria bacterium SIG28]
MLSCVKKINKKMFKIHPKKQKKTKVKLLGAVQINNTSYFVCKNVDGNISLKTGQEEKLQKKLLNRMIELNPRVRDLLGSYKIRPTIDTKTLRELAGGHMNETCNVAIGIYSMLPQEMKSSIKEETIKEASMLHDLGKVLIPSKILNKPSRLNKKEREIMNIHSTLGYELLKTQNIKEETLDLVKYHHQNLKCSGYPALTDDMKHSDIGVQIISTADKYSALREARVYRRKLSRIESLLILYKEVLEGKIHKEIYKALIEYARIYDRDK